MTPEKRRVLMNLIAEDLINSVKPISLTMYRAENQWKLAWYRDLGLKGYVKYLKDKKELFDRQEKNDRARRDYKSWQ